jgi:trehalose/maltose hydrolase-like predicted phosphorylase
MTPKNIADWQLTYNEWNPQQQPLREALCALGNG